MSELLNLWDKTLKTFELDKNIIERICSFKIKKL
jgi:hypothetical protein